MRGCFLDFSQAHPCDGTDLLRVAHCDRGLTSIAADGRKVGRAIYFVIISLIGVYFHLPRDKTKGIAVHLSLLHELADCTLNGCLAERRVALGHLPHKGDLPFLIIGHLEQLEKHGALISHEFVVKYALTAIIVVIMIAAGRRVRIRGLLIQFVPHGSEIEGSYIDPFVNCHFVQLSQNIWLIDTLDEVCECICEAASDEQDLICLTAPQAGQAVGDDHLLARLVEHGCG